MDRLQQLAAAAAEAHSSPNSTTHPTANRTDMSHSVAGVYTEKKLEAAATMLTLGKPILLFEDDVEAAHILVDMSKSVSSPKSDSERTKSDNERTLTAEPSPVTTPTRAAMPSTYTVGTLGSIEDVGISIPTAIAAVPARTVKVITLKEYIAMKVGRKDREAQKNA